MSAERWLVTTIREGKSHTSIWSVDEPLGLEYPIKWVAQKTASGILIQNVQTPDYAVVSESELDRGNLLPLPGDQKSKILFQKSRAVTPAYVYPPDSKDSNLELNLYAFSGVRKTITSGIAVHSAYVGYSRNRPVFILHYKKDGVRIQPMVEGLYWKPRGHTPQLLVQGKDLELTNQDLRESTLARGYYWWRFSRLAVPRDEKGYVPLTPDADDKTFKQLLLACLLLLFLFTSLTIWGPHSKDNVVAPLPPVVKFQLPRAYQKPVAKTDAGVMKHEEVVAVREKVKTKTAASAMNNKPKTDPKAALGGEGFKKALGGALSLIKKDIGTRSEGKASADGSGIKLNSPGGQGLGGSVVRPGELKKAGGVGAIGGGGGGAGSGVGYSQGDVKGVAGQGKGWVDFGGSGAEVNEGLTKEEVGAVIHKHADEIRYCYEAAQIRVNKIEGKLVLQFTISGQGIVKKVSTVSTNLPEGGLENCIIGRLKTWKFPQPRGKVNVDVSYPFVFKHLSKDGA